jgi:hypothetical protein
MSERQIHQSTPDGHFVVINGRRWRATDPAIPEDVSAALRAHLMAARRAVGAALRTGDQVAQSHVVIAPTLTVRTSQPGRQERLADRQQHTY